MEDFAYIPFHVVACSSEEYGTQIDLLSQQKQTSQKNWESSRTGSFPVEIIIRFHYRSEISHIAIASKQDKHIPEIEFFIGDGLSGSFIDAEYRKAGYGEFIHSKPTQINLEGIGNFLKIVVKQQPKKSQENPFQQISIALLKIWGKYTNYLNRMKNEQIERASDKSDVDKILIGLGIPIDLLAWFDEDAREWEHSPMDEDTRITIQDMIRMKDLALQNQDFQALKQLSQDIKVVFDLGIEIYRVQRELNMTIAQEDYSRAMELKSQLQKLRNNRDSYDALYETSRYEQMIVLDRPSTADYQNQVYMMDQEAEFEAQQRRMKYQQQQQQFQQIIEPEPQQQSVSVQNEKEIDNDGKDKTPWWEKTSGMDVKSSKKSKKTSKKDKSIKEEKKQDSDEITADYKNPFAFNEGDVDLESYLKPLISKTGESIPEIPAEVLRRLHNMGYLTVFGAKLWSAVHSENWRLREAAAQAVLNFIEMPLPKKYLNGQSKKLFLACMEMAKLSSDDKILSIYFLGLKILSTALAPPVCGTDVSPKLISKITNEFQPLLINKIAEMNFRARDISLHTLLSIFKHPASNIGDLVRGCLQICIEDPNFTSLFVPPDKQPERLMLCRLEIILKTIQERGYDERQWTWEDVFVFLCIPCLFHSSNQVRMLSIEIIVGMYQLLGEDVRKAVSQVDMKPKLQTTIFQRMDKVKNEAQKNQKIRNDQQQQQQIENNQSQNLKGSKLKDIIEENPQKRSMSQSQKIRKQLEEEKEKEYQNSLNGIIFALDAIIPTDNPRYPHFSIISMNPPAGFYVNNGQVDKQTFLVSNLEWDMPKEWPHFFSHQFTFNDINKNSSIIIDIKYVEVGKKPVFNDEAWTIFPVYQENGELSQGTFQLPLFKFPMPVEIIKELSNQENPWTYIQNKIKESKIKYFEWQSVIVRSIDVKKKQQFGTVYLIENLDSKTFIPQDRAKKFLFDKEKEIYILKEKKLNTMLPSNVTAEEYQKTINENIATKFQIPAATLTD